VESFCGSQSELPSHQTNSGRGFVADTAVLCSCSSRKISLLPLLDRLKTEVRVSLLPQL